MKENRVMRICKWTERITVGIGILSILLPIFLWKHIPEKIPMHYNAAGKVDNWSDKGSLILLFFCIAFTMGLMAIAVYFVKVNMKSQYTREQERTGCYQVYPMLVSMNLVVQLMFSYMIFASVTCRNLGTWFMPVTLIAVALPIVLVFGNMAKKREKQPKEMRNPDVVYRTKIDWWLGILLVGGIAEMLWMIIERILNQGKISWYLVVTFLIVSIMVIPLFFVQYAFYPEYLLVDCKLYGKERIPYECIQSMKMTRNPLSSAVMSLKRIQIDYWKNGHQMVLISPKNRELFIKEIESYQNKKEADN